MKHFKVTFKPDSKQVSVHAGTSLVEAAGRAGIILSTVCGGRGTCGKCKVTLLPEKKIVLACKYLIDSDIVVQVDATSRILDHKILASGTSRQIEPDIYKKYLQFDSAGNLFGVAADIGTTTVVAKLIDLISGQCKATASDINPQIKFGDDVISRISYGADEKRLGELQKTIVDCLNTMIKNLCDQAKIKSSQIFEASIVGNTTMNHILLKLPIVQLGIAPYKAYSLEGRDILPGQISLNINPAGNVHVAENIAGFVGADTTAVVLASDINPAEETIIVDIGTNGEIVLSADGKLYAASCAAGPALEGARISCGSRAQTGAIEAVTINGGDIEVDCTGQGQPRSICGSGLIDAIAVMLNLGVIDSTGRFCEPSGLAKKIRARIVEEEGQPAFKLADDVVLTQKDIRQVQLAKAAIRAGSKLLQRKVGLKDSDIDRVLLAGAFGNYIKKQSALRIGLLPEVTQEKIIFIGNAASSGAEMMLLSGEARKQAKQLAQKIQYVEIANEKDFADVFAESMMF